MIPKELEAEILRLYHAEKWPVGTIADQLHVHHSVVTRVLEQAGVPKPIPLLRPSKADPFVPFIVDTLKKYPRICASRVHRMVCERGYQGGADHFRRIVRRYRPSSPAEAYIRLRTLPGEQAQVDWGHFGKVGIGNAVRSLMAFVMVLSWSRKIFLRFFLNQKLASFLRGHQLAFDYFGGVPRVCLYDNLKSVVLQRKGNAIRFQPTFLDFAGHYRFEARPVNVARGNEKGRVERAIGYIRTSFFAAREWHNLEDLNKQALAWCDGVASIRPCPEDRSITVRTAMDRERDKLLPLPGVPFPTEDRKEVTVRKTPYVRFDGNDYSVPHRFVQKSLVVLADETNIRIIDGQDVVAEHGRSYDKHLQIEKPEHIQELLRFKKQARKSRAIDRLHHAIPISKDLMICLAQRGENLGAATNGLLRLLKQHGSKALEAAIKEALEHNSPHLHSIHHILDRHLQEANAKPPMSVPLPNDERVKNISVRPQDLEDYDNLNLKEEIHGKEPSSDDASAVESTTGESEETGPMGTGLPLGGVFRG